MYKKSDMLWTDPCFNVKLSTFYFTILIILYSFKHPIDWTAVFPCLVLKLFVKMILMHLIWKLKLELPLSF